MTAVDVVLTGATGYVGRHLLPRMLAMGLRVLAITRDEKNPRDRLLDQLGPIPDAWQERLSLLRGEAGQPFFGVDYQSAMSHPPAPSAIFLHAAGLPRFETSHAAAIITANQDGLVHAYDLARAWGFRRFHHISTAFVAGNYGEPFGANDLQVGQGFRNPYEAAKYQAELHLALAVDRRGCEVRIHRPSILLGGRVVNTTSNLPTLYNYIKTLHFIRECCRRDLAPGRHRLATQGVAAREKGFYVPLRVEADPEAGLDLIPVHWFADRVVQDLFGLHPPFSVRQHVAGSFTPLSRIRDAFCQETELDGVIFANSESIRQTPRNPMEERFYRATKVFQPYLHGHCPFLPDPEEESPAPQVDLAPLARGFLEQLEGRAKPEKPANLGELALSTLEVDNPSSFFQCFLSGEFGASFFRENPFIDASVRFHLQGGEEFDRVVRFRDGHATLHPAGEADCLFEMDQSTFLDVVRCRLDARQAFFQGLVRIAGNQEVGLKFAFLLGEYFRKVDDHVLAELVEWPDSSPS